MSKLDDLKIKLNDARARGNELQAQQQDYMRLRDEQLAQAKELQVNLDATLAEIYEIGREIERELADNPQETISTGQTIGDTPTASSETVKEKSLLDKLFGV